VHLNHVGLNAPEKLKPEKISTKYKKTTYTNKKKRNRKKSQALKQVCLRRQKKSSLGKVKWSIGRTTWCAEILAQDEGLSRSEVYFLASLTEVGALSIQRLCDVVQWVHKHSTTG
jgi:hypothetical protein